MGRWARGRGPFRARRGARRGKMVDGTVTQREERAMTDDQWGLLVSAVVLAVAALVTRLVTRAAAAGRLRPNQIAGMRTTATLSSPEAWRAGNLAAVGWTGGTSTVCLILALAAAVLGMAGVDVVWGMGFLGAGAAVLLCGAIGGAVAAHRAAKDVRAGQRRTA